MGRQIGFWHDYSEDREYWRDGLWAAMHILQENHTIQEFTDCPINIVWTGSLGEHIDRSYDGKVILLYAGGPFAPQDVDATVVEDRYSKRQFADNGVEAEIAFGTNTDLFYPRDLEKKWDVIFPAAFANWKRHEKLVEWVDDEDVLVVGKKQDHEKHCYRVCEEAGFDVQERTKPQKLAKLYNQADACWIPSETMGGSQRTLLEARACGLDVRVADDNPRLQEMMEYPVPDHHEYAEKLENIIDNL